MRRLLLISFLLIAIEFRSNAQPFPLDPEKLDSFNAVVNSQQPDTSKVHAFYWMSRGNTLSNPNKSIELANKGVELARKNKFFIGEIECLEGLCFAYAITSSFDIGIKSAYQQIELSRKHAPVREIFGINMMGLLYQKLGDDKEALAWAQKAYYHPQLKESDPFTQWSAVFLLAQEHERSNNLDSATYFAKETLDYSNRFFPRQASYPTLILARISSKQKKFAEAFNYFRQILSNRENSELDFFLNEVHNEVALSYYTQNNTDSAQYYANLALNGAEKLKNYIVLGSAADMLSQIYVVKNPMKAYELQKLAILAKDSVTSIEKSKHVKQLEIKEQQRVQELNLADVYAKNELRFNTVMGLLFTALLISFFLYRNNRQKQKANAVLTDKNHEIEEKVTELKTTQASLAARNAENELLLKEIHHRVKNNLEVVTSLLALQSAQTNDPSVQSAMLANQNRVHSMGIIHQKLYQGENLAAIEMRDYFINLSDSILDSFNAQGQIKVECNMPKLVLDIDTAVSVGLITNELLTNSLKYAFKEKEPGAIKLSLTEERGEKEGTLLLRIADDGMGKPVDENPKGTGFGTQLINLLSKQLGGILSYEINNGTVVTLRFKKPILSRT